MGEKVGVYFDHRDNTGKVVDQKGKNWYCGHVKDVNEKEKTAKVEFLQQDDEGWYPVNHEMRPCTPNHDCTANVCYNVTRSVWRVGNRVRRKDTK